MTRLSDHQFVMPYERGEDEPDPFFEPAGRAAERVPPERESPAAVSPFGGRAPVIPTEGTDNARNR